jgi:lipid II:glycine glycyltransferase (peptidoglycan interpeptide bridge formation enzyme)
MEIFYFTGAEPFDAFLKSVARISEKSAGAEYLQSGNWGEILRSEGKEIIRVGVREEASGQSATGRILAVATLVKMPLAAGYFYWVSPRGPIFLSGYPAAGEFLFSEIKKIDRRALFWRIEPNILPEAKPASDRSLKSQKTIDLQPAKTLILDLDQSAEALRAALRQKTRYNLSLAEKKEVKVVAGSLSDFSEFWRLMSLTSGRDNFRLHTRAHYKNLLAVSPDFIKLFFAEYRGRNIAAGLFCFWGDKVTYLHGASDNEFRNVMAPYLLQWSLILAAKNEGYRYYDFYGIDEEKWPGVTRFKLGFGGRQIEYPGTSDVIFNSAGYRIYNLARKIRRLL